MSSYARVKRGEASMATVLNPLVIEALEAAIGDNLGFIHGLIGLSLNTHMRNGDISPDVVAGYLRNLRKNYRKIFGEHDNKVLMIDDFTNLLFGENFSRLA